MISVDHTLFVQVINVLLLVIVLNFLLFKPMLKVLDDRNRRFEEGNRKICGLEEEIVARAGDYEARLKNARTEATALRKKLIEEGTDAAERLMVQVSEDIRQIQVDHEKGISRELEEARRLLPRQVETISAAAVDKLLGRSIQ